MLIDPRERVLLFDVESRSRADLKKVGGRNYWEHPTSEILVIVWCDWRAADEHEWGVWLPGDPPPPALAQGVRPAAHNYSGFDRFACWRAGWFAEGSELDQGGVDTAECARMAGLPGALDALGTLWLDRPKDKAASRFTVGLSKPSRAKKRLGLLPEITPAVFDRVLAYCQSDVEILVHGWPLLLEWWPDEADLPGVLQADRAVNDRGVYFDQDLARALLAHDALEADAVVTREAVALGLEPDTVRACAKSHDLFPRVTGAPDATKETVRDILLHPETYEPGAESYARARQALASIARGKLRAGLARVSLDSRLRDAHRYLGAHPGRWSQRGMQLHNIPRPSKAFKDHGAPEIARDALAALDPATLVTGDAISSVLLRATLQAPPGYTLAVCDYSGVEARMLAWAADDYGALDVFIRGASPYKVAAGMIFGCDPDSLEKTDPRYTVGKAAELMLQYGAGAAKFEDAAHAALKAEGIEGGLAVVGVSAKAVVGAWRALHAPSMRFHREIERACVGVLQRGPGAEIEIARGLFRAVCADDGNAFGLVLPSGRMIVYRNAELVAGRYGPQIKYQGTRKKAEYTYGGKLTENVIQAACRDLLALGLVRVERAGLRPVLHVHDEIVCEIATAWHVYKQEPRAYVFDSSGATGLEALKTCMLELPAWAEGFPVGAAGHVGVHYRK